ncbi:type II toxin-antitoxin system PemK/MazF family toxin [Rhizobium phaseoli]
MTKNRFVVIMTPGKSRYGTCVVVPLSTKEPKPVQKHHHCILVGSYSFLGGEEHSWVKGDMVTTVSYSRLDRVRVDGTFASPSLTDKDFEIVRSCVKHALML